MGTQGWSYDGWSGSFYPSGTRSADRLALYARAFDAVEVDSTFYALPPPERYVSWRDRTPEGFVFTLKMPGEVTHELALEDPRLALRFCDDARRLGPKLGPILIQLPPRHGPAAFDATAAFLRALPDDLRFAIEFRDRAWLVPETLRLLREVRVALTLSVGPWLDDAAARSLAAELAGEKAGKTADLPRSLLYLRWLGAPAGRGRTLEDVAVERGGEIDEWGELIPRLGVDEVYAFFNNDYQGHSPASARRLQALLGQTPVPPAELSPQKELFG